jgi:hypothetical protein
MRGDTVKTKVIAVVSGALLTLVLWAIIFVVLNGIYQGNLPWLLTALAAILCPLAGGYGTALLSRTRSFQLGALSGFSAGLVPLIVGALASRLAPNTTLAGVGLVAVGAIGGGVGTLFFTRQRPGTLGKGTERERG